MKIVIAGASGYLGSQLANHLAERHDVYALVRSSSSLIRLKETKLNIVIANNYQELDVVFNRVKPDVIINTVALYGRKGESLAALVEANIAYPTQLADLAAKHTIKGFIHTGTSLPDNLSAYSLTKNTFSKLIKHNTTLAKFINVELEHFYGPGDDISKFISYVIEQCKCSDKLDLTAGEQLRDFVFIKDVLSAYDLLIDKLSSFTRYESFPLGSGEVVKVRDIVKLIAQISHSSTDLNFGAVPMRENELMYSCADITKLKKLGWQVNHNLHDGLSLTILEENK